ncbi:MAG: tetratricopeptide repeat protein [Methanothrix sp.]|nr:tetratricopeptide repeat protein [Methanothrix sp.]
MSHTALLISIVLLTTSGLAADVPFVFGEGSRDIAGFTSAQLEQASSSSPNLVGVPFVSSPSGSEVLELPIVGGGSAPVGKTETKEDDLKKTVSSRVEPDHSTVHEVALLLVAKFPGDLTIDQICSIYSYMKNGEGSVNGWSYARDPRGSDFFMYANQSLKIGGKAGCSGVGDCDDFAILMSALVESIGGTTRIIFVQNKTMGGHAYVEVYLGNLSDPNGQVDEIINWLKQKFNTDKIYTHIDTDSKDVWLNLDWGADEKGIAHPGGPFYRGDRHIVVCAREQFAKTSLKLSATKKEGAELSPAISLNITTDEIESKSAEVWFNKGVALTSLGRYDEALQAYDRALEMDSQMVGAWHNKGHALNSLGRYDEALQAYDKAIQIDPKLEMAWSNKGSVLDSLGKYDEAIKAYNVAIKLNPNYSDAWNNKGYALEKLGKYEEAVIACDKAIEIDPQNTEAWNNKCKALNGQGKYYEAVKICDLAIQINAQNAGAWGNKGIALHGLGQDNEAINCFDKVLEIDPLDVNGWYSKGTVLMNLGKSNEAIQALDKATELDANHSNAWNNKGLAFADLGRYDDAIRSYDRAIEINPHHADAWLNKGSALLKLGRYNEAMQACNWAIEINPQDFQAWQNIGLALKAQGRNSEADAAFAKARELGY